jgi:hypothetical protein
MPVLTLFSVLPKNKSLKLFWFCFCFDEQVDDGYVTQSDDEQEDTDGDALMRVALHSVYDDENDAT